MSGERLLAIDQGTSATKAVLFDEQLRALTHRSARLQRAFPQPGWVEQDAIAVRDSVYRAATAVIRAAGERPDGIGLSVQRESVLLWDAVTGVPVGPMLSWQDRRGSAARCASDALHASDTVRTVTGLPVDPMFSALKLSWLLDTYDPDRRRSGDGSLRAGTVDAWLLWSLTGKHQTEIGCAARTQLLDIGTGTWSEPMLDLFNIPRAILPDVMPSTARATITNGPDLLRGLEVRAVLGDSHAALFAHAATDASAVKVTYGTGSSVMGVIDTADQASRALTRTIGWQLADQPRPVYAFEGNILATGSAIAWTAGLLDVDVDHLANLARTAADSGGVDLVPAFAGLGAPWWDGAAEAVITGLTLGTARENIARAAFESVTLQVEDVLQAADQGRSRINRVHADGGPTANTWLMQLQADLSDRDVTVLRGSNGSCRGVAIAAGTGAAPVADDDAELRFTARPDPERAARIDRWERAVRRARSGSTGQAAPPARREPVGAHRVP